MKQIQIDWKIQQPKIFSSIRKMTKLSYKKTTYISIKPKGNAHVVAHMMTTGGLHGR